MGEDLDARLVWMNAPVCLPMGGGADAVVRIAVLPEVKYRIGRFRHSLFSRRHFQPAGGG